MTDRDYIKTHKDPKMNAAEIAEFVNAAHKDDSLGKDHYLDALFTDVVGLLYGIAKGTIKTGQPRIVEQLLKIVQNYPKTADPSRVVEAIGACSEQGLAAEGHSLQSLIRSPNS